MKDLNCFINVIYYVMYVQDCGYEGRVVALGFHSHATIEVRAGSGHDACEVVIVSRIGTHDCPRSVIVATTSPWVEYIVPDGKQTPQVEGTMFLIEPGADVLKPSPLNSHAVVVNFTVLGASHGANEW